MTNVSWTRQLGLAVALLALGSTVYWFEFKQRPTQEAQEEKNKKIFAQIVDTAVRSIQINDGTRSFDFECLDFAAHLCKSTDNSKWEITKPFKVRGDDTSINGLLTSMASLSIPETIDLKEETPEKRAALLKDYGLDAPARGTSQSRRITLNTGDKPITLHLGQSHPIGEGIFALSELGGKVDENKVYIVPSYFKSSYDKDLTHWREKKILTIAATDIQSFKLTASKGELSGERSGDGKDGNWTLRAKAPKAKTLEEMPGDTENIESLLSGATSMTAKAFPSESKTDDKARALLKGLSPFLSLTMTARPSKPAPTASGTPATGASSGDAAPITLTLYSKGDKLYATASNLDPLYELDATSKDRLNKSAKDLRLAKLITSMERFGAKRLEFSGAPIGSEPIVLTQKDGKWTFAKDGTEPAAEKIQGTLDKLNGNRIKEFLTGSAIPTGEDQGIKLTLGDEKSETKRQLVFWKHGAMLYARDLQAGQGASVRGPKEAFLVDSTVLDGLPWDASYYKRTAPPTPGPTGVTTPPVPVVPAVKKK